MNEKIGFVGAGQMARALAGGLTSSGLTKAGQILAVDPSPQACEQFANSVPGVQFCDTGEELIAAADIVVLAVKPQVMAGVMEDVAPLVTEQILLVSIAAGLTLDTLSAGFGSNRIVRVMPNTPSLVGAGAAGYALGSGATEQDAESVRQILECVGLAFQLDERLLDAVTGLSGSGPAYVYTVIEAMSDGGVRMGLPRPIATRLAAQTVLGAARMVADSGEHPAVLRDQVTSPGGTTIAGLHALENHGLRAALIDAVVTATQRSVELREK